MLHRADKASVKRLDRDPVKRETLAEADDLAPWAALYASVHHFGYPNNKVTTGSESTFSYLFESGVDGVWMELADHRASVVVRAVSGDTDISDNRDTLAATAQDLLAILRKPVHHFGLVFDPLQSQFAE